MVSNESVIEVKELHKHFPVMRGFLRREVGQVKAVDGVSFSVQRGETLALVGESGCGKTTTGRCIVRAIEPSAGAVLFRPHGDKQAIDLTTLEKEELRQVQRHLGMVFQDPY
jgi:peptide/nickel transport system ATP-binding protein